MIELSRGIATLTELDLRTALSPVFRTFLEAYVEFKNMIEDPAYINHCYARHHHDWIRVLKESKDPNPYLAQIGNHASYDAVVQRHESGLQELKDGGFGPLKILNRFEKAGMANEYRSIYHFESDGSHNSLQAMIERHIELGEDGYDLALYRKRTLKDYEAILDSTAGLLMDATRRIAERLKSERREVVEALSNELAGLRASNG